MIYIIASQYNPTHEALEIYLSGCKQNCPDPPAAQAPVVAATQPDPEEVAAAPEVNKDSQMKQATNTKRKGTSALRIQLNVGGMGGSPTRGKGGGGNGLSI